MIADVAFDAPLPHPFAYRVPEGVMVFRGQRVAAPLGGATRVGVVVGVREGDEAGLKELLHLVDETPLLGAEDFSLAGWIASESLTSLGSTCFALLPPPSRVEGGRHRAAARGRRPVASPRRGAAPSSRSGVDPDPPRVDRACEDSKARALDPAPSVEPKCTDGACRHRAFQEGVVTGPTVPGIARTPVPGVPCDAWPRVLGAPAELLVGAGRETRLLDELGRGGSPALVLTPDVDAAGRWAQRLAKLGACVRLDSGVGEAARASAWAALASGSAPFAIGTRSALLTPLPPGATLALVDEHEAAHKPPGAPRMHARDVVLERAARYRVRAVLTSATPSVEAWHRVASGRMVMAEPAPAPWPQVTLADTRGIGRREALMPPLARAIRETLAAGRRVLLVVSRLVSALGCDECGAILKCERCAIALAYSPAGRALACRLCAAATPLPETCPACHGRRLAPFGWGAERVEHAVRRRFVQARIARYDPEAAHGHRAERQRVAAAAADVVIGTRGALRLFGPGALGLAAFVSPDQLLGLPDFRAAERAFELAWAAAERVRPDGALVIQTQNPEHYAFAAVARQDLQSFYAPEVHYRGELGYPPFRRLAIVTASGPDGGASQKLAEQVAAALAGRSLTVYPPAPDRRARSRRVVVKGGPELSRALADALRDFGAPRAAGTRGMIEVEVDPVEWPS